jgi:hypothetical protein
MMTPYPASCVQGVGVKELGVGRPVFSEGGDQIDLDPRVLR